MTELNKFGAVIKFVDELEKKILDFYEAKQNISGLPDYFPALVRGAKKRFSTVERVRREMVNEMLLEPIADLHADLPDTSSGEEPTEVVKAALALEAEAKEFYERTAEVIKNIAPSACRTFKRFAKESAKRIQMLQS